MSPTRRENERPEPLRIALVLGQLDRGGSEGQALELARGLARHGHEVRVFSFRDGPRRDEIGLPCRVPSFPFAGHGFAACLSWLRGFRPHAAYTFGARAHSWGRLAARAAGVPTLLVGYRQQRDYWLDRLTLRWNAAVVCKARVIAERVARRYGLPPERLHVIPNGVDVDRFTGACACDATSLGLRPPFIVQTARLHPNKDHETALRAFQQVRRTREDVELVLVGDGPRRASLERLALALGVSGSARFLGTRADVAPILAGAAVGWLSSRIEGAPNAVLECLAAGVPVVATRAGGTAELLRDGEDGFLCDIGDACTLAQRTLQLLADDGLRARLGAEGRRHVSAEFPLRLMVDRTESLLRQLVAERPSRGTR